ncbi:MAG: bifunctional demethylmenaquinone methyltransferase/2-methoxy-6-polyprenyl-1,4-benzoquinol methylase UbiE [Rhodothermales bacterium]|nr:bifunctional demethylmenaquinone methyltransferase/2-methoxy-6-polyprenyl-1,4-benzoquinol methylase UbiE [Rhodothermales bacterium]
MPSAPPIGEVAGKKEHVGRMFDNIAPRYDLLNRVLSLGIDRLWRKEVVRILKRHTSPLHRILDVATGTADLAIESLSLNPEQVIGVDIAEEMLAVGRTKIDAAGAQNVITLQPADAENLPFGDDEFDAVTVAFGVRNFENLGLGLSEMSRVLKPGGKVVILEFSQPRTFPIKQLYAAYSRFVLPHVGRVVSKDEGAYTYLPESVAAFPDGEEMTGIVERAGFTEVRSRPMTFGIVTIYHGQAV